MKQILIKTIAVIYRRLYFLFAGKVSGELLRKIVLAALADKSSLKNDITRKAFQEEYISYVNDIDLFLTRDDKDPLLSSPSFVDEYLEEFQKLTEKIEYRPAGMINTELLALYVLIRQTKPQVFIESGTKNGYSSIFIAEALKRNGNSAKMYCLSLFTEEEKKSTSEFLSDYSEFLEIKEGYSEESIETLFSECKDKALGFLIDGPKARSKSWDVLMDKILHNFNSTKFIAFDCGQEHVPLYSPTPHDYSLKRGINLERLKIVNFFEEHFKQKNYFLTIQSNPFCMKYHYLNEKIYQYRNDRWGSPFPWGPFRVDKIENHIAFASKMAIIYKEEIFK